MKIFTGFPAGKVRFTSIPDLFFSELLPLIDDLAEAKVTLHILWLVQRKPGYPRGVNLSELAADRTLCASLQNAGTSPEEALRGGLDKAVARGTLLHVVTTNGAGHTESWYFPNTDQGRRTVAKVKSGALKLGGGEYVPPPALAPGERPNIFVLYEQNIGLLQPLIADELKDAAATYPATWVEEAFRIAVEQNKRSWAYVRKILERWARQGKGDGEGQRDTKKARRWFTDEEYRRYIKH